MSEAKQRYVKLLQDTLGEIGEIDRATPWQNVEPDWWISMMALEREIRKRLKDEDHNMIGVRIRNKKFQAYLINNSGVGEWGNSPDDAIKNLKDKLNE